MGRCLGCSADEALLMGIDAADVLAGVAVVGQVVALGVVAVLVGSPGDGVGDALPVVAVLARPHVVAQFLLVTRIRNAVLLSCDAVGCFVPEKTQALSKSCSISIGSFYMSA